MENIELRALSVVPASEFSVDFVQGMLNRMMASFAKYGLVAEAYPDKVNALQSLRARLDRYEADGNTEWLMDVANFAMIEFMHPARPHASFTPTEQDSPGRVWHTGERTEKRNNGTDLNAAQRAYHGRDGD